MISVSSPRTTFFLLLTIGAELVTDHLDELLYQVLHALRRFNPGFPGGIRVFLRVPFHQTLNPNQLASQLMKEMGGHHTDRRGLRGEGERLAGFQKIASPVPQQLVGALQTSESPPQSQGHQQTASQEDALTA